MSESTQTAAGAPQQPKRGAERLHRLKVLLGIEPEPEGRPSYIWLERWDAFIIAAVIVIGVPLLGLSGFDRSVKWVVAALWFAIWAPFFMYFEGRELIGQMQGRGSIKPDQASEQQSTAQDPFYGVFIAVFVWLIFFAVHVAMQKIPGETTAEWLWEFTKTLYRSVKTTPVEYGLIEWLILVHAWIVTRLTNYIMYNMANTLLKAAPMGERVERRAQS